MPWYFFLVFPQLKKCTLTISSAVFVNCNAMSDPDLDKIRFHLFLTAFTRGGGEGAQEEKRGLNQSQQEGTKKPQYLNSHKIFFVICIFYCKKKRTEETGMEEVLCLNHFQCFLSKPSEQLLADTPIPLILYLFLHQCREWVVTPYILVQMEDDLEFSIV